MPNIATKAKNYLFDLIFPKECIGCGTEGTFLCSNCKKEIILIKTPYCPSCKKITANGAFCCSCHKKFKLTGIIIAAHYKYGPLRKTIHHYKYESIIELKNFFAKIIIKRIKNNLPRGEKIIIPVPLHPSRERERGFNQSEQIGNILSQNLGIPLSSKVLARQKRTLPQTKLKKKDREKNIISAFVCLKKEEISGKTILLLDDIVTTGLTLNEAAKVLKKNGAKSVWGVVVAQG